jgi:hypothetical protein
MREHFGAFHLVGDLVQKNGKEWIFNSISINLISVDIILVISISFTV